MSGDGPESAPLYAPTGLNVQAEVISQCSAVVQQFRDGKFGRPVAFTKIMGIIPNASAEGGPGQQAAHAYLGIIDQVEKERVEAAKRGDGGDGGGRSRSRARSGSPNGGRGHSRSPSPNEGGRHRPRSPSPDEGGRHRSCSPNRGGRHHSRSASLVEGSNSKRQRLNDSMLPWVVKDFIVEATLSPELQKTRNQLIEFAKDPKYVLGSIRNSTRHIAFPDSEWLAIIKGDAVDLNKVIASQFSVSHEPHRAEPIGEGVQILFGSSTPTKSVSTQAEWLTAWAKAADAITFVFPHRRRELDAYRQYIIDLFISSAEHVHQRIILLDRKLRNEAAGRRDLLLSDCARFAHWERSFLNDNGAAYLESKPKAKDGGKGASSGSGGEKRKSEPCKRFNDDRCPASKNSCRYAHICLRCKRNHPVSKCDRPSALSESFGAT
ncbi:hypothetical protein DFH07DRAFT_775973 [Mycena maculata]|uniref:C3H1-type domain-containing protein n=1 Tax=Mycena maculata TaxID=230809 RepID=A0AAD7IQU0_9AGAR|nr:hypothetical protein DFH07DRAFT_775973 [Mycena maculata]